MVVHSKFVINDSNWKQITADLTHPRGYRGMWLSDGARSAAPSFRDQTQIKLLTDTEIDERIDQAERDKATLKDFALDMNVECLDQGRTNYCWINAPVFCAMLRRLIETGQEHRYSPASGGAVIKGFQNVGGWGSQALAFMIENGINYQSDWPPNAIDRRYYTAENREKAKLNRVTEYYRLETWQEVKSCIAQKIPCGLGYNWWRHEVTGMCLTLRSHNLEIANSWGNWGDRGYGTLEGSRRYPDDAVAIVSMTAA